VAERTRPGYCAGCFVRRGRTVPAFTIYQGTSVCTTCLAIAVGQGWMTVFNG
jgi:hypothetical protein